ncbi:hypothetical protein P153DRAFT_97791 [Dothidotthia symphoricarpi CBS 119687]|uniref:Uncharacterized protein n=1 Tax=Dothidotthia symphoricarpi CBS 119687 TaxID=1392245 RepID=A0A6A6AT55_9PLEO|nr:uncharacterized protein P153DRAFT_97791 [Dothidotthia symphoricarpi CBS 119687]KAF2133731.1 hypothetical protein P153DRAFT_97791 [Dothidotthia symphoricarpi CBS 119687]
MLPRSLICIASLRSNHGLESCDEYYLEAVDGLYTLKSEATHPPRGSPFLSREERVLPSERSSQQPFGPGGVTLIVTHTAPSAVRCRPRLHRSRPAGRNATMTTTITTATLGDHDAPRFPIPPFRLLWNSASALSLFSLYSISQPCLLQPSRLSATRLSRTDRVKLFAQFDCNQPNQYLTAHHAPPYTRIRFVSQGGQPIAVVTTAKCCVYRSYTQDLDSLGTLMSCVTQPPCGWPDLKPRRTFPLLPLYYR